MSKDFAFADLCPRDPAAPFENPTEDPGFSPDYREIVPELDHPGSCLPLLPTHTETVRIRRYYSLTCLALLFAFLAAMTVHTALTLAVTAGLRAADMQAVGTLPENYNRIISQYFSDSSLSAAVTLIAFLVGNLSAFYVGCRLTGISPRACLRTRDLHAPAMISYVILGLWIQLIAGVVSIWLNTEIPHLKMFEGLPEVTAAGSLHRLAVMAIYSCIVAPVTEELLMRGFVLRNFCRVSQRHGIFISALLFGVMHENLPQFLFAFPLGILLAYITLRHNSVLPAIGVHITVNTVQTALLIAEQYLRKDVYSTVNMVYTMGMVWLGAIVFSVTMMTERLPATTPHQSMRGWRIICSSPLFWLLIAVHVGAGLYQSGLLVLPFFS